MSRSRFPAAALPWWTGFVLAALVFVVMRYVVPLIAPSSGPAHAVFKGFAQVAWMFALPPALASIVALIRRALRRRLLDGQRDLDSIRALHWQEFEHLVGEAFRRRGYRVEERGGAAPDGGIDLVLFEDGRKTVVQCKRWKTKQVGVALVRELYGAMTAEKADEAIFAASGEYTADARAFAEGKPICLVDGPALFELVRSAQRAETQPAQTEIVRGDPTGSAESGNSLPACPRCGNAMAKRVARTGSRAGAPFWGCTVFPSCRGTRPIG